MVNVFMDIILFSNERTPGDRILVIGQFDEYIKELYTFCEIYFVNNVWSPGIDITIDTYLPFENGSFDHVINTYIKFEQECFRVLKKNKSYYYYVREKTINL